MARSDRTHEERIKELEEKVELLAGCFLMVSPVKRKWWQFWK